MAEFVIGSPANREKSFSMSLVRAGDLPGSCAARPWKAVIRSFEARARDFVIRPAYVWTGNDECILVIVDLDIPGLADLHGALVGVVQNVFQHEVEIFLAPR